MSDEQNKITTEEEPRDFFSQIPNMVDEMGLTVYAYRLYGHFRRVAGEAGTCWQGTAKLAEICGMSAGKITEAKRELQDKKLISVQLVPSEHGEYPHHEIRIISVWRENHEYFTGDRSRGDTVRSPGDTVPSHQVKGTVSPGETKKNPIKNNPIKNKDDDDAAQAPNQSPPEPAQPETPIERPEIFRLYESTIGFIPPILAGILETAWNEYPHEWFPEAFRITAEKGGRSWAYAEAILKDWKVRGFQSRQKKRTGVAGTAKVNTDPDKYRKDKYDDFYDN